MEATFPAPRRRRNGPRHWRRIVPPPRLRPGGWNYVRSDNTHYGASALVSRDPAGTWSVFPYSTMLDHAPVPAITRASALEAREAWDTYVRSLYERPDRDHTSAPEPA